MRLTKLIKSSKRISSFIALLIFICFSSFFFILLPFRINAEDGCTIGDAMGNATTDGRPISWKDRDAGTDPVHFVQYLLSSTYAGGKYGILGMGFGGSGVNFNLKMGVNDQGLSLQNSLCDNLPGVYDYDDFKQYLLSQRSSVADVRAAMNEVYNGAANYWRHYPTNPGPAICAGFSDAQGAVSLFELNDNISPYYYDYNPTNPTRLVQFPKQTITRANTAHRHADQTDDLTIGDRYPQARDQMTYLANNGGLNPKNWIQTVARLGQPGVDWMPNNNTTQAFMLVHGVNAGEDPRIVTAWLGLGNPDYTIGVPAWVAQASNLSPRVTGGSLGTIGYVSDNIYALKDLNNYDQYINGLFAPVENNIFEAVDLARIRWFSSGFNLNDASRIHQEAAETAYQTMYSMSLGTARSLNVPPGLTALNSAVNGTTVTFSVTASDPDGSIAAYDWDFGDGTTSTLAAPVHTYSGANTYLVRARVVDNNGARNSKWKYIAVGSGPTVTPGGPTLTPTSIPPTPTVTPRPTNTVAPTITPTHAPTATPTPIPGDLNNDGKINLLDWLLEIPNYAKNLVGLVDVIKDGKVNALDLVYICSHFNGQAPPISTPVPSLITPTPVSSCNTFGEPNDTLATAYQLALTNNSFSHDGAICSGDPNDNYKLNLNSGQTITIDLTGLSADLDLYLYNPSQVQVALSENSGTIPEQIMQSINDAGTWYIQIAPYQNALSSYNLSISVK